MKSTPQVVNRILPDGKGFLTLAADLADLSGGLQLETMGKRQNIGYWANAKAVASWDVRLAPNRTYTVEIEWACAPGQEGGAYVLEAGGSKIAQPINEPTGSWKQYRVTRLGPITTGADGDTTVTCSLLQMWW